MSLVWCGLSRQQTITSCLSRGQIRRSRTRLSSATCLNSSISRFVTGAVLIQESFVVFTVYSTVLCCEHHRHESLAFVCFVCNCSPCSTSVNGDVGTKVVKKNAFQLQADHPQTHFCFSDLDLDLDLMTLIHIFDLIIAKMYSHTENQLSRSRLWKIWHYEHTSSLWVEINVPLDT